VSEPEELWQKCPFTKAELDKMRRETQQRAIGELADAVADNRAILEEILRRGDVLAWREALQERTRNLFGVCQ
jgi:hypothetical protein